MEVNEELVVLPDVLLEELADVPDVLLEELVGSPDPRVQAAIAVTPKKTTAARDSERPTFAIGATSTEPIVAPQTDSAARSPA